MKKLITILIILLFVWASPAFALEIGDKMPDTSGIETEAVLPWHHLILGKGGEQHFKEGADGFWTMEAFLYCDGKLLENPFGIYISELKVIYLDGNMDRIIDEIIVIGSKRMSIGETAPECPSADLKISFIIWDGLPEDE